MTRKAASAVVFNIETKEFLVLRRADSKEEHPGLWEFPGGYVEKDESPRDAAIRELKEETGIIAEPIRTGDSGEIDDLKVTPFLFAVDSNEVELSKEHTEFRWIEQSGLEKLDTIPGQEREMEALNIQ